MRVVHSTDTQAHFKAQTRVVPKALCDFRQRFTTDVQGQLVAVPHDFLDGAFELSVVGSQRVGEPVDDVVEVAAVGPGAAAGQCDLANQAPISGRVTGTRNPEHAAADVDDFLVGRRDGAAHLARSYFGVVVR